MLVRHGDAHAGFHGVIGGERGCAGLTELGRTQAEALRDHFAAIRGVAGGRAAGQRPAPCDRDGAIIAPGLGLEIGGQECDLCEVHTGEADGLAWTEYADRYGSFDMEAEPDRVFAPVRGQLEQLPRAGGADPGTAWPPSTRARRWWPCATPG